MADWFLLTYQRHFCPLWVTLNRGEGQNWIVFSVFFCFLPSWISALRTQLAQNASIFFFYSHSSFFWLMCKWLDLFDFCYLLCCYNAWPCRDIQTSVWSEDSAVVPNKTEEWWHTATMCWQNLPTLKLPRCTDTLTDVYNLPNFQNKPLCAVTRCRTFHLTYFFTVRKSQHSCLLELAVILVIVGAILRFSMWIKYCNVPLFFHSLS